jgi:c-di-GMP-binding flagellar brake protein YcgR
MRFTGKSANSGYYSLDFSGRFGLIASSQGIVEGGMERRSCPRVGVTHPVIYHPDVYPRPRIAKTVDISMGGTKIESPYRLNQDEDVKVTICTDSEVIKCRGKVVYVAGTEDGRVQAGIQFRELSKGDRIYLGQYLSYVMERQEASFVTEGSPKPRISDD